MSIEQQLRKNPGFFQWVLLAAVLLFVGSIIGWYLYSVHNAVESQEGERLAAQAKVVDENLGHQLRATNSALDSILRDLPRLRSQKGGEALVSRRLQAMSDAVPGVRTLSILDAEGTTIASNREELVGRSFREREYFKIARQSRSLATLHVSPPFKTVLGVFAMNVVKKIPNEQGEFAGVISATLDPDYFSTLLESVRYSSDSWTSLAHADGNLFMMLPQRPGIEGISLDKPGSFRNRHLETGATASVMTGIVAATGEERMMAQRTIKPSDLAMDKSLSVAVARDLASIFAPWRKTAFMLGSLFGIFVLTSTLGLYFFQQRQRAYSGLLTTRETERKEAEVALREGHATLSTILETTLDGFWRSDCQGNLLHVNAAYCQKSGYSRDELLGMRISDLEVTESAAETAEHIQRIIKSGGDRFESKHRRKDGSIWDVEVSVTYRNVTGGEFVAFVRNITERKKSEARLRDEKERMGTILDTVADPIFVKDNDHRIVLANPAFYEMFALDKSSVIGKTLVEAVPADERQHFLKVDRQVLDTGLTDLREETLTVGGLTRTIITRRSRLILHSGEKYLVGSIHDITEPKRLEVALIQSKGELQGLARSVLEVREEDRRKIARELHDDLGHRVTTMSMDLEKLESKLLTSDSEAKAMLPAIVDQVYQFADATRRICEDLRPGMLDALGLPAAIEGHVDSFVARTGIPCELVMSHNDFVVDTKVGINLFRIVQEALNNALKYAKATNILVTFQFSEHEISLIVEDNGIGFAERGKEGRIGFGLLGIRERVNSLNGHLSIDSEPGCGVRIEAVIPT